MLKEPLGQQVWSRQANFKFSEATLPALGEALVSCCLPSTQDTHILQQSLCCLHGAGGNSEQSEWNQPHACQMSDLPTATLIKVSTDVVCRELNVCLLYTPELCCPAEPFSLLEACP